MEDVKAKLKELKDAISGGSTQAIKVAMASLNEVVIQLGQSVYSQSGAPGAGPKPGGADTVSTRSTGEAADGDGDGDVIDSDFTESR